MLVCINPVALLPLTTRLTGVLVASANLKILSG